MQYDALDLFDYGDVPPLSPSLTNPCQDCAPLQCNFENDVSGGGNVAIGSVYKGQGRHVWGRVMQSAIVGDDVVVGRGRRIAKIQIVKDGGWDRSSDVRMLFEEDPARLGHPLHVEMSNKQGACVLKIKCRICGTFISYHNNS